MGPWPSFSCDFFFEDGQTSPPSSCLRLRLCEVEGATGALRESGSKVLQVCFDRASDTDVDGVDLRNASNPCAGGLAPLAALGEKKELGEKTLGENESAPRPAVFGGTSVLAKIMPELVSDVGTDSRRFHTNKQPFPFCTQSLEVSSCHKVLTAGSSNR